MSQIKKILCIVGPTASGKTDFALKLAVEKNGEIINADSRQFYREMFIGTAKPSPEQLNAIPHHLIDVATLAKPWSAGDFVRAAGVAIDDIIQRGKLPIVVGGTGLYVRSLLEGLDPIPETDPAVRAKLQMRLETEGLAVLFEELKTLDPEAHARLKSADTQRILRALEIILQTGQTQSSFWQQEKPASIYDAQIIGLKHPREVLYEKINARTCVMLASGLKSEAQKLWEQFPDNIVLSRTIGYAEWPECDWDDTLAAELIARNTRHFAKRQMTWFGKHEKIEWISA